MDEPSVDPDEVEPRLYLIGPDGPASTFALEQLGAILGAIDPAAFLTPSGTDDLAGARELRRLCAERNTAFFVQDDVELAQNLSADGLYRRDPGMIKQDRKRLSETQILGAEVGRSRHEAMVAGEAGADYIAFGRPGDPVGQEIIDLVVWWREMTILPSLAFADTPDDAVRLVEAGADFIGVSGAVWNNSDGPDAGALLMQAAIEKN